MDCSVNIKVITVKDKNLINDEINFNNINLLCPKGTRLDKYFNDIQVAIQFKYNNNFFQYFSDLREVDEDKSYIYFNKNNNLKLVKNSENSNLLKDYVRNGVIKYITLNVIDSSKEDYFLEVYNILDDFDKAIQKLSNYDMVNIITENHDLYKESYLAELNNDCILGDFTLLDFRDKVGHSNLLPTYVELKELNAITNNSNILLTYTKDQKFPMDNLYYYMTNIYLKNVIVEDIKITIPYLVSGIDLEKLVINSSNKELIPNVSRNNIDSELTLKLSYGIGRAIHTWIYKNANLNPDEKALLNIFIEKFYSTSNSLLSNNTTCKL